MRRSRVGGPRVFATARVCPHGDAFAVFFRVGRGGGEGAPCGNWGGQGREGRWVRRGPVRTRRGWVASRGARARGQVRGHSLVLPSSGCRGAELQVGTAAVFSRKVPSFPSPADFSHQPLFKCCFLRQGCVPHPDTCICANLFWSLKAYRVSLSLLFLFFLKEEKVFLPILGSENQKISCLNSSGEF